MYKIVDNIDEVIEFIKKETHKNIPVQLWNRQLWLYDKTIDYVHSNVINRNSNGDRSSFYINKINDNVNGVVYCEILSDYASLLIDSDDVNHLESLIYSIRSKLLMPVRVYVIKEDLSRKLEKRLKFKFLSDYSKYMYIADSTCALNQMPNGDFRKLNKEELLNIELPYMLKKDSDSAIFYGRYLNKSFICICSIMPITDNVAEILDVISLDNDFFKEEDRYELIKFSIIMLKDLYSTFSIKVDVDDYNMIKTIESLGFVEMYKEYFVDID